MKTKATDKGEAELCLVSAVAGPFELLQIHAQKVVKEALNQRHIPRKLRSLILDFFANFSLKVSSGTRADWHKLQKRTKCTISVILFALTMNMLLKSAEVQCSGPLTKSRIQQPLIQAFMDDLTVRTKCVSGNGWILNSLEELISWLRGRSVGFSAGCWDYRKA